MFWSPHQSYLPGGWNRQTALPSEPHRASSKDPQVQYLQDLQSVLQSQPYRASSNNPQVHLDASARRAPLHRLHAEDRGLGRSLKRRTTFASCAKRVEETSARGECAGSSLCVHGGGKGDVWMVVMRVWDLGVEGAGPCFMRLFNAVYTIL